MIRSYNIKIKKTKCVDIFAYRFYNSKIIGCIVSVLLLIILVPCIQWLVRYLNWSVSDIGQSTLKSIWVLYEYLYIHNEYVWVQIPLVCNGYLNKFEYIGLVRQHQLQYMIYCFETGLYREYISLAFKGILSAIN